MRFKSFWEFVMAQEGLWLSDDNAVEGWTRKPGQNYLDPETGSELFEAETTQRGRK
jgi:hypothetical protein